MATVRTKRPPVTRTNDVDRLASKLGSSLKLSAVPDTGTRTRKGMRIAQATRSARSPEDGRAAAMKNVNSVLQGLAVPVGARGNSSRSSIMSATTGRAALNVLRKLDPQFIDTERAALCMAGKLLALNVHDVAIDILEDVRNHLATLYTHDQESNPGRRPISLLQLPLPTSCLDLATQTCVQTYLCHSISAAAHIVSTKPDLFDVFYEALDSSTSLQSWSAVLTSLPQKSLDTLFKRAYASLTSTFTRPHTPPLHVLRIRFHALRTLLLSNELDVTPFWEQCLKVAMAYARDEAQKEAESEKVAELLTCFTSVNNAADGRREGKGWIVYCEYWLALAKRAGDMRTLSMIAAYIRNAASSSNDSSQLITRTCTTLTQLAATLEHDADGDDDLASKATLAGSEIQSLLASFTRGIALDRKLWRAMERCRKSCAAALSRYQSTSPERNSLCQVLLAIVGFLEHLVTSSVANDERTDGTISALDALFQLAIATFSPQRAESCDQAFEYLTRGLCLIECSPLDSSEGKRAVANYLRCLSGAFANLAGALYKAERHGFAIRFLSQACPLSNRASNLHSGTKSEVSDKDHDAWSTHHAQVYRRWELLGVCYVKTGSRRLAHDAFVQGVVTYPFEDDASPTSGGSCDFQPPASLTNAIDRLTHLAASELRLDGSEVSLKETLHARGVSPAVVASILLRQACSLSDRSKPHIHASVSALLTDALSVYDAIRFPIRRARTLVLVLEHTYYSNDKNETLGDLCPENILKETEVLLSEKAGAGEDVPYTQLRLYYRTTIQFWVVLHAHRSGASIGLVSKQLQQALNGLEALVSDPRNVADVKSQNGVRGRRVAPGAPAITKPSSRTTRSTTVPSSKARTVRSNSTRRPATTLSSSEVSSVSSPKADCTELGAPERAALAELLLMTAELLDLSGLILMKAQLLVYVRRLLEKYDGQKGETFFRATAMLAHLLSKLGKISLACELLAPIAAEVRESVPPSSSAVLVLLRYAEVLSASANTSESISAYEDAFRLAEDLPDEESGKGVSAVSRIRSRAITLERIAVASNVFAVIQDAKDEPAAAFKALLQALRLLNRATDTLARLNSTRKPDSSPDPFSMSDIKEALPGSDGPATRIDDKKTISVRVPQPGVHLDGLEWRIANTLFETQLALVAAYALRGSPREAEYFEQQAEELARILGSSAWIARVLVQKSELQMSLGNTKSAHAALEEAMKLVQREHSLQEVDVRRAIGDRLLRSPREAEAHIEFDEAENLLGAAKKSSEPLDKLLPATSKSEKDGAFLPVSQAKILRQQVWLLRDVLGERYEELLEKLFVLAQQPCVEIHINSVLGRLALYDIHERFRADMSLSSLTESTIALPLGMSSEKSLIPAPPQDIVDALRQADEHYVSDLSRFSRRDSVVNVRSAAVAEALISTYQASIGITFEDSPAFASHLLDMACSITVRRELMDAILFKFPNPLSQDDMRWPSESSPSAPRHKLKPKGRGIFDDLSDDDDDSRSLDDSKVREYWNHVLKKHQSEAFVQTEDTESEIDSLPENWMVVTISLTENKNALLLSRQRPRKEPMVFCVPLKGRGEDEEEGHFSFDNAMTELKDIIKLNDEGARGASQIKPDDKEAKIAWWASRKQLDERMKNLVENIEFCWLGAFKTILSQPMRVSPDAVSNLRGRLEKVFKGLLGAHERKSKRAKLQLDASLLEVFSALPPTCRDEELQDLIYFVLDLYHFHGLPVALAEVDIDLVVIDLRTALEEFHSRNGRHIVPEPDAHAFLVLDKNVQGIPWESLPVLRGHSVSRVPSTSFIMDRLAWARSRRNLPLDPDGEFVGGGDRTDRVQVNPSKGYFILNPSRDLSGTEGRFKGWVSDLRKVGWDGVVGKEPSEQQFLNALSRKDLVVYFGHGGAEQYARSHRIRHLQRCAATMLWGCSSGALRDMGDFDRTGTPNNYMLAGCPSLVANLWDVTDRDIDKFAQSVFTKLRLEPEQVGQWQKGKRGPQDGKVSVVAAVAQSRDVCKLKYLTGAAVVIYGIPFYL